MPDEKTKSGKDPAFGNWDDAVDEWDANFGNLVADEVPPPAAAASEAPDAPAPVETPAPALAEGAPVAFPSEGTAPLFSLPLTDELATSAALAPLVEPLPEIPDDMDPDTAVFDLPVELSRPAGAPAGGAALGEPLLPPPLESPPGMSLLDEGVGFEPDAPVAPPPAARAAEVSRAAASKGPFSDEVSYPELAIDYGGGREEATRVVAADEARDLVAASFDGAPIDEGTHETLFTDSSPEASPPPPEERAPATGAAARAKPPAPAPIDVFGPPRDDSPFDEGTHEIQFIRSAPEDAEESLAAEPPPITVAEPAPPTIAEPAALSIPEPTPFAAVEPAPFAAVEPAPFAAVEPAPFAAVEPAPFAVLEPTPVPAFESTPVAAVEPAAFAAVEPAAFAAVVPAPFAGVVPAPFVGAQPTPVAREAPPAERALDDLEIDLGAPTPAEPEPARAVPATAAPAIVPRRAPDGPAPASRLPREVPAPVLSVPAQVGAVQPPPLQEIEELVEGEWARCEDASQRAELSLVAARAAERVGDRAAARRRYEEALTADPNHLAALRGLRRTALAERDIEGALATIDRQLPLSADDERGVLEAMQADLLIASGNPEAAEMAYRSLLRERPDDARLRLGLLDAVAASAAGTDGAALRTELQHLASISDGRLRAACEVEIGRLVEVAGEDPSRHYQVALAADPECGPAAFGLLRAALFRGSPADELAAADRLTALARGPLAMALRRRAAALRLDGGDPAAARTLLAEAADVASLRTRLRAEEAAGELSAAARTVAALAEATAGEARFGWLLRLGELQERKGSTVEARVAYQLASELAPADLRPSVALERLAPVGQRSALAGGGAPPGGDAMEEAFAVASGRFAEAASLVAGRAAGRREAGEGLGGDLLGERAARLHRRAGDLGAALEEARRLDEGPLAAAARRLQTRMLAHSRDLDGRAQELLDLLGAGGSVRERPASAGLWHLCGLALEGANAGAAATAFRRGVEADPEHAPSLVGLELLGHREEVTAAYTLRAEGAPGPGWLAHGIRAALGCESTGDPSTAIDVCLRLLAGAPASAAVIEDRLLDLLRRTGDPAQEVDILGRRAREGDAEEQRRLAVVLGERYERLRQPEAAIEQYRRALPTDGGSAVVGAIARSGVERALAAAGKLDGLEALLRESLERAATPAERVASLERLALLQEEQLGDGAAARRSYEAILAIDPAHAQAFRALEKRFVRERQDAELLALYEQAALPVDAPAAVALLLERARLKARLGVGADAVYADLWAAARRDGNCRAALRPLIDVALGAGDDAALMEACDRLAEGSMAPRSAGVLLGRAAGAAAQLGRVDDAVARYQAAIVRGGEQAPAIRGLLQLSVVNGAHAAAVAAGEAGLRAFRERRERIRAGLIAGSIASTQLGDADRAFAAFRAVLGEDPSHPEAFARVDAILEKRGAHGERAAILAAHADAERDPRAALDLRLRLSSLFQAGLKDVAGAKQHLAKVLEVDPVNREALGALAELHERDGDWAAAAELLIRRARLEKEAPALKDVFTRLGTIYADHLPDAQRALASWNRVLQYEPDSRVALHRLATLYERERDFANALPAVVRLAHVDTDPLQRVAYLLHAAGLQEKGLRDARGALETLRRALALVPHHLPAIAAMAQFFERQGDPTSARVHVDRSIQVLRQAAAGNPLDPTPYHGMFELFVLRRSYDQALLCADVLTALSAERPDEQGLAARFPGHNQPAGTALADPAIDESLLHPSVPAGFRHLFRILDEPLQKHLRSDVKRLGVTRQEKLPRSGHALRDIANQIATSLGLSEFDVYLTASSSSLLAVELTDPISIIIGEGLVEGAHEREMRFLLGRQLKMIQARLAVPLRMNPEELGVLVGGLVRQFVPDFLPNGFDEPQVAAEAARLSKAVPKKLHHELLPFALECAAPDHDWRAISTALQHTANRAGLLAAGSISNALSAVRRLDEPAQMRELLRFAVSEELAELRRAVGVAVG